MRQEISRLVQEVDPELLILDSGMNMHAADQHAPDGAAHIRVEKIVTRRGGVLLSLLVLPLLIPVLIFAVGAGDAVLYGAGAKANLMLLGGMLLGALALTPWVTAHALREAVA